MIFDTLRVYDAGQFYEVDQPDWYREAESLGEAEKLGWYSALDRVLDCEHTLLTEEGVPGGEIELRFWPSAPHGTFVLFQSPLGLVEQVVVINRIDWLPFLTSYITPFIAAAAQLAMMRPLRTLTNAFIAFARHGEGPHVDRWSGLSRIDRNNDDRYVKSMIMRAELKRKLKQDPA